MEYNLIKGKLDELVQSISSSSEWIIGGIPAGNLFFLKGELESRLPSYTFDYLKPVGRYNVLIATRNLGVEDA
jgi:hypothetical protein